MPATGWAKLWAPESLPFWGRQALHQETNRTGCLRCANHSCHLPVETGTACPSPAAQLQGPASGAGGTSEERAPQPGSLWAVTRSHLLISKINSTMINVMIYSTNDQNHCFSDPRAIKCNHWVIYSGQGEWWRPQRAGCVWGEGSGSSSILPGHEDRRPPFEMEPMGAVSTHPTLPSASKDAAARSGELAEPICAFFQNDRESLPGVPQSTRWEWGKV